MKRPIDFSESALPDHSLQQQILETNFLRRWQFQFENILIELCSF